MKFRGSERRKREVEGRESKKNMITKEYTRFILKSTFQSINLSNNITHKTRGINLKTKT